MPGLKIKRMVLNTEDLLPLIAASRGDGSDVHVTLIYSRASVDHSLPLFQPDPNPLVLEVTLTPHRFENPDFSGTVLLFDHPILQARHQAFRRAGCSWDFPTYHPHITLGPDPQPALTSFRYSLILGPEKTKILTG